MFLKGKVAIVTGGNSGIGKAIVLELAEQGANVAIDYVSHADATEDLERRIVALGDRAIGVDADVSKIADLQRLVDATVKAFGRLDIMVNNAGIESRTSVLDTTEKQYDAVLQRQPEERVLRHAAGRQTDDQAGRRRSHHQHHVGSRRLADARQHRVLPVERRHAHAHAHGGRRTGSAQDPRRGRRPRSGRHAHQSFDDGQPRRDGEAGRGDSAGADGAAGGNRQRGRVLASDRASYITATTVFADGGLMQSSPGL